MPDATRVAVTVTVAVPEEGLTDVLPAYDAVIRLPPVNSWPPESCNAAVATLVFPERPTVPRAVPFALKVTLPVGTVTADPVVGVDTVAVSTVLPPAGTLAGLAARAV